MVLWYPYVQSDRKKTVFYHSPILRNHKKRIFYGQAGRKGGRGAAPSALTVSECENFDPFFPLKFDFWYSIHILSHWEGSQKCIFPALFVVANVHSEELASFKWSSGGASLLQMIIHNIAFFLSKIRFRTHIFIIWGKNTSKKYH